VSWFIGAAAYLVIWWLVIFTVLPIGVRRPDQVGPGHDAGAPADPRLKMKALVTTIVAGVIWVLLFLAVEHGLMNFRGST
jgi:predicted secreted protein